jgi:hypothetical protein
MKARAAIVPLTLGRGRIVINAEDDLTYGEFW